MQNSSKLIASGDAYANKIFNEYNKSVMSAFPQLTADQIMDILIYVKNPGVAEPAKAATATDAGATAAGAENKGASAWYIWALVAFLLILASLLWTVTSKLDKAVREKAGEVVEDIPLAKIIQQ